MTARELARTAAALKWALLRGGLRAGPGATVRRWGLGASVVVGALLGVVSFVVLAASGSGRLGTDLAVVLYTGLVLGWIVLPILTFGSDDLLDPRRLALFPLTRRQLVTVMGVGALIGVPPAATTLAALGLVAATGSLLVGVVAVVLQVALCVTASRAAVTALSGVLRSRRGRDLGVGLAALAALGFQLLNPVLQSVTGSGQGSAAMHRLADVLRWTPPGLLASAPGRPWGEALGSLVVVLALVVLLLLGWQRGVRRSLERADASGPRPRDDRPLAPSAIPLPPGRAGAVAAKDLRYLAREPRRLVALLTVTLLPLLIVLPQGFLADDGPSPVLVFAVCGVALLAGTNSANRFGTDGNATWLLIATATDERAPRRDLVGGDLAVAVVVLPAIVLFGAGIAALTDGWGLLAAAIGVAAALLAVQLAVAELTSVLAPFPVPESGNAFSGGNGNAGQGCATGFYTLLSLVLGVVACLPLLALGIPAVSRESPWWDAALLLVGPAYGLLLAGVIHRGAARRWAARGPEVLEALRNGA